MLRIAAVTALAAVVVVFTPVPATLAGATESERKAATDAEKARWTMADMRTLAIALKAYHTDHGMYPKAESLAAAIPHFEPIYVRKAPNRDAWGTDFVYVASDDGSTFMIVSAGADAQFKRESWAAGGENEDFGEDAVVRDGSFIRSWSYR